MADVRFDVVGLGNAIVDVLSRADDAFLAEWGIHKNAMNLIEEPRAHELTRVAKEPLYTSGGSGANTIAGLASFGASAAYIGKVADDELGAQFKREMEAGGVPFPTPPLTDGPATARSIIFVTEDGHRSMNTFLGASQFLPPAALDDELIASAGILYLEGYLWDPEEPRSAMRRAIEVARKAGRKVAFTASESFVIDRHGDDFRALIEEGQIDILFVNEHELATLTGTDDFEAGLAMVKDQIPVLVATRSAKGAVGIANGQRAEVAAEPIDKVVDTTGAGDLFAAGFLTGHARGESLETCLRMGAICAAEIISHYGARSEADLKALVAEKLG